MQLILASSSPFRKMQLEKLQRPFIQLSPHIDESRLEAESVSKMVLRLGILKAREIAKNYPDGLIIASDQTALSQNKVLGKPGSHEKAVQQLQFLSNQTTTFYTSIVLLNARSGNIQTKVVTTEVKFRKLDLQQIENYLKLDQPYQCAGSFKSESLGVALFEKVISEDPDALIGLPLITLVKFLANQGYDPLTMTHQL